MHLQFLKMPLVVLAEGTGRLRVVRKLVQRSVARTWALAIGWGEAGELERYLEDGIGRSGGGNLVLKDLF